MTASASSSVSGFFFRTILGLTLFLIRSFTHLSVTQVRLAYSGTPFAPNRLLLFAVERGNQALQAQINHRLAAMVRAMVQRANK